MANLNELTNEQREQHRMAVCIAIGLSPDPALGLLDYIWMLQENGMNNLVLYAKRGALELVRDIQGIDIKNLEQHDGPGYVSFKATAVNKKGRQEIAVGAHEIEGLKGKKLADAIATAQTRALRRVTLQFAGHGILDESEVTVVPTNIVAPAASQAALTGSPTVLPPPQAPISQAPGKDITSTTDMASHIEKVYADGAKALADMKPDIERHSVAQNPPIQGVSLQQIADIKADKISRQISEPIPEDAMIAAMEPRKKRAYKRRNTVALESPGQQIEMPVGQIDSHGNITIPVITNATISVPPATANEPEQRTIGNGPSPIPALAETPVFEKVCEETSKVIIKDIVAEMKAAGVQPVSTQSVVSVLSKEKQDEYRTRLSKYYNDILPRGGMQSSEKIGGPTMKVRKFAAIHTGVTDTKLMTEDHWNDLFEFLDTNAGNPKFLVDYINKALGVA